MAVSSFKSYKNLVEGARTAGISDEDIKGYLSMQKTVKSEHKEIWNQLLRDNDLYMSSILGVSDIETFLEEIMKSNDKKGDGYMREENEPSEKSKKLMEKIELLSQKIEQEKSPLKRHLLVFQVKMLIAKIQREIDLQNIKSSYDEKRKALLIEKDERETDSVDNIAILNGKIKQLQKEIKGNEEYDVKSSSFMYPKKYVEQLGGVENLAEKLRGSRNQEAQRAAGRIEEIARKREELDRLKEELQEEQENLKYSQSDYKRDKRDLKRQEMGLVVRKKFNIFSRIGEFFRNIAEQVTEYREEKSEMKELKGLQKEDEIKLKEAYEREMQRLKEEYAKSKEDMRDYHEGEREAQQSQVGQNVAANFRRQMAEMGHQEGTQGPQTVEPEDPTRSSAEPVTPPTQGESEPTVIVDEGR